MCLLDLVPADALHAAQPRCASLGLGGESQAVRQSLICAVSVCYILSARCLSQCVQANDIAIAGSHGAAG